MNAAAIVMLSLAFQAEPAKEAEPTLKPLCEIAKRLDEGIQALMAGKDMKESFKNWDVGETPEAVITKLREDLAKNHVATAKTFGVELRLRLYEKGELVYEVDALVHATPTDHGLIAFRGRPNTSTGKPTMPADKLVKDAKPFGDAGRALLHLLQTKKPADLPFVDFKKIAPLMPPKFKEQAEKSIEKSRSEAEKVQKELIELKHDELGVQLDEQYFSALGAEGESKDGWIRGKLRFSPEGDVTFRLSRFETK